jgi:hypothetical protein
MVQLLSNGSPPRWNTYTAIGGATTTTYTTPTLTATTYYKVEIKDASGNSCLQPTITIGVNNPQLLTTTPGSRCGPGTVTLSGTGSAGSTVNWYTTATGGTPVGTGLFFTTPILTTNTTYYAAATTGGSSNINVGLPGELNGTSGAGTTNFGIVFDALSAFTLNSVVVYPVSATAGTPGTVTIDVINAAGTVVHTATVNVLGYPTASPVAQTVNLNFNILPGTNYKLRPGARSTSITGLLFEPSASAPAGGNYGYPFTIPGILNITTSTLTAAPTNTARNDLYYYFYNWSVSTGCESARTAVIATVSTGPAFDVTNNTSVCNNAVLPLTVNSPAANFNSVTWAPTAGLYTNAAATTAYTGGNASTVYVKQATAGVYTYVATAVNSTTSCSGIDSVKVTVLPATLTIATSSPQICVSGTTTLSVSTPAGFGNATFQWLQSPTGTGYTPITGATSSTYTTPVISTAGFYQLVVKDGQGSSCLQPTVSISVNNPQVLTTTPATNCAASASVTLGATASAGATLNWYSAASGGTLVGSGSSFTTPVLTTTTTYYVAASSGNYTVGVGKPSTTGADGTASTTGTAGHLKFDALSAFTLNSVVIYPAGTGTGTVTIAYQDATGVTLTTSGPITVTGYATPTPVTIPLGFAIAPGTQLRLTLTGITGGVTGLYRDLTGNSFPYTLPNKVSITDGSTAGTYFYFYNWQITTTCESARTAVQALVNAPTTITTQPVNQSVCSGANVTLSVVATGANLTYQWFNGANPITGATNSTYVINNATPANSGAYKVTITGTCGALTSTTINLVVAPSNSWIGVVNTDWNNAANWCGMCLPPHPMW